MKTIAYMLGPGVAKLLNQIHAISKPQEKKDED